MVVGATALALAACGSSGTGTPTTTTAAPTITAAESTAAASSGALAAYRGMWADLVAAARTSDYRSQTLDDHATGSALTLFVQGLARDQLHHIVTKGHVVLDPAVTSVTPSTDPDRATVTDCVDDSQWIEYTTSGKRADNPAGGRRRATAVVTRRAGTWKVTQLTVGSVGTC
jgi:hypothetical protein